MAYSYKGAITFGLIYIPINLSIAIKNNDIGFNMLDKKTMTRVQYKKTCVDCGDREVKSEDIVKGYQYEKDKYVIFNDEDFEKIKSVKDKQITIDRFIDIDEIDPLYFDKAYYVVPQGAEKAYKLLLTAMEEEGKAGIAKTVLGNKQTLICLHVKNGVMIVNTLFFHEEVQNNPIKNIDIEVNKKELDLAKSLINAMKEPLKIEEFKDEYRQKLQEAIQTKIEGKEIVALKEQANTTKVLDLMKALEMSLTETKSKSTKALNTKTAKVPIPATSENQSNRKSTAVQ